MFGTLRSTQKHYHPKILRKCRPRHKIGIEFAQLLRGVQLLGAAGQQHVAMRRFIQPGGPAVQGSELSKTLGDLMGFYGILMGYMMVTLW